MHPHIIVEPPETLDGRPLNATELALWAKLEGNYGPQVVGDGAGDDDDSELPSPSNLSWCALYPLAIYYMNSPVKKVASTMDRPHGPEWIEWNRLLTAFWQQRDRHLKAFHAFLADWNLSEALRTPREQRSSTHDTPYKEDRKVLGLHKFQSWEEVADYALRWGTNPLIRDTHLWQHRMTVSRGIDLISSELLHNGFQHGGKENTGVFIMAKLCSHESAWRALELNKRFPYLTDAEVAYFQLASENRCPILQLCIGDGGQGFGSNQALAEKFLASNPSYSRAPDEAALIDFALSGKVTTKTRKQHRVFWSAQVGKSEAVPPTVHGLAEVLRFVRRMHGYWRIHSHGTAIDHNFLNLTTNEHGIPHLQKSMSARPVDGCLHYFMLPLLSEKYRPAPRPRSRPAGGRIFRLVDAADDALARVNGEIRVKAPEHWVGQFCDRIVKAKDDHAAPLLIHLGVFDRLDEKDLEDACLDLVHCLYHVRDDIAVFLSGASEKTTYQLCRYTACPDFEIAYRILPFLTFGLESNGSIELRLGCSDKIERIEAQLVELLAGGLDAGILRSETEAKDWSLYRAVCEQNHGLFRMMPDVQDEVFRAQIQLALDDPEAVRLAFGGCSFAELAALLRGNHAVIPDSTEGYFRLGKFLHTYVHLGRLWADPKFRFEVAAWLRIALHRVRALHQAPAVAKNGLIILAVLHPAIELAHDVIRNTPFADAEVVEIRRLSDLRWDYEPLLKLRGIQVVILVDVIATGGTATRIIDAVRFLGLVPLGCFSVLSIGKRSLGVAEYSFCQCTKNDLVNLTSANRETAAT